MSLGKLQSTASIQELPGSVCIVFLTPSLMALKSLYVHLYLPYSVLIYLSHYARLVKMSGTKISGQSYLLENFLIYN